MVPVAPIVTGITFVFTFHVHCISIVRSYILEFSQLLFWSHFCLPKLQHLLTYRTCSLFIITNYNVWFVVRNGSVSLNLMIPQYGYGASLACFYWFWDMFVPLLLLLLYYYYYHHRRRRRHHHHHHPRYLLYAGYLQLYSWDKPCPYGTLCCNYSDVTIHGAHIASSCVDSIVFLR
jgi:hypothetical protein